MADMPMSTRLLHGWSPDRRALLTTPERVLTVALAVGIGLYTLLVELSWAYSSTLADVAYPGLCLIGLTCLIVRSVRVPTQRLAWSLLSVGILSQVAGEVYFSVALADAAVRPWPSWSDVCRASCIGFCIASLIVHLQARQNRNRAIMLMDILATTLLLCSIGVAILPPALEATGLLTSSTVARLVYIFGDLLLVATALAGAILPGRMPDRQLGTLLAAIPILAVSDFYYLSNPSLQVTRGGVSEILSLVSLLLVCWGACLPGPAKVIYRSHSGAHAYFASTVPILVGGSAAVLLSPLMVHSASTVGRWCACAALLAVGVRSVVTTREIVRLVDEREESHLDHLTGLLNRAGMVSWLTKTLDEAKDSAEGAESVGLLLLDIDQFKEVNDSLGHHLGDAVITALGRRLAAGMPYPDTKVARMGGDEFAVLAKGVSAAEASMLAQTIVEMMHEPVVVEDVKLELDASIGVAVVDPSSTQMSDLLRWADIAMYRAKAGKLGYSLHDPLYKDEDHEDRLRLLADLRVALKPRNDGRCGTMVLYYQPKIELATGRVIGCEALIRWCHPDRGLIFPDSFLPLADDAGLMPRVTELVLSLAIEQASVWWSAGQRLTIAVNLPSAAIVDAELPVRISAALDRVGLPPAVLVLEITEESLLRDRVRARVVLAKLRALGVTVSIDDYGTGYSSLAYLRELPVDELKLDRSFVFPMSQDERAAAIVRSTVDLAHSLGLRIVAEGVEDELAAEQLGAYGCDDAQGYHYSKPVPPADFEAWLSDNGPCVDRLRGNLPSPRSGVEVYSVLAD